jgi:hypothetical protein
MTTLRHVSQTNPRQTPHLRPFVAATSSVAVLPGLLRKPIEWQNKHRAQQSLFEVPLFEVQNEQGARATGVANPGWGTPDGSVVSRNDDDNGGFEAGAGGRAAEELSIVWKALLSSILQHL